MQLFVGLKPHAPSEEQKQQQEPMRGFFAALRMTNKKSNPPYHDEAVKGWGTRIVTALCAEDEGVGVGVGCVVGEIDSEAGGVLGEGERACADEFDALDGFG